MLIILTTAFRLSDFLPAPEGFMADDSPKKWFKLEESFFKGVDHKLMEKLRKQVATEQQAEAIQRLTGLTDMKVCQDIAALNISVESLAALRLAPLVAVAWADDRVEDNERFRVIHAAEKAGLKEGDPSYELLKGWLAQRPSHELFETWVEYAKALALSLDGESRANFQRAIVAQVRDVAEASGGLFGLGSISPAEHKIIDRVEAALA
ncbi:MAG: hypothetical protein ACTHOU_12325 [Aureliella sp.]